MVTGGYRLDILLKLAELSRSTYYYNLKRLDVEDKDIKLKEEIVRIFQDHKSRYGYRRITMELRNQGIVVNSKKVRKIMKELGLRSIVKQKRKYSSYQGDVGKKADNLINRKFSSSAPLKKLYTDVTEFSLPNIGKLYLSPILDGFNGEIINYSISRSADFNQLRETLNASFTQDYYGDTILHSDQGWQYQHRYYHKFLKEKGITPSMSRKGNSLDNGMMESFFSTIKSEIFYVFESTFHSLNDLTLAIKNYIYYYNNHCIKLKLKGLSPVSFRTKSFS